MLHAWDRSIAARAITFSVAAELVALVVTVATDQGAPWARRAGMLAALAPVAGSVGALVTSRIADARGELRALAALGVSPPRAMLGAMAGAASIGLLGALAAVSGATDLGGLFPRPPARHAWVVEGDGLGEVTEGVHVSADGRVTVGTPVRALERGTPEGAALFTGLGLAAAAVAGPVSATAASGRRRRMWLRLALTSTVVVAGIAAFHAVGARRVPAGALLVAPVMLLLDAAARVYGVGR